jgi:chromosome segregation ATPase
MTTADARGQSDSATTDANADLEIDHAALDEPRGHWQAAEEAATRAENQLSLVLGRLEENAERRSADEAALQAAIDQQAELKRAIKASAEQRETLRKARSKAQREAEEARKRSQAAEAKYDEALLAEVLAAQKAKDLTASNGQAQGVDDEADAMATPIEPSTAQATAAAVTARNAGV